jgi:WD40 repeat protein
VYSWDQSYMGKQGVNWLEERGMYSYLLDCGGEINQIDIRSKEAVQLIQINKEQAGSNVLTNLSVHPTNKNLLTLCRGNCLQIWDLRKASSAVVSLAGAGDGMMAGGGWSRRGSYLVTCVQGGAGMDDTVVYNGLDFSQPLFTCEEPRIRCLPYTEVTWCPWEENIFLTTMEKAKQTDLELESKNVVVAVDCTR